MVTLCRRPASVSLAQMAALTNPRRISWTGASDRVSEWPENEGRLTASSGGTVRLRGASSSHYQREGEPVFTAVAGGDQGPMAHSVTNRCHPPLSAGMHGRG